ncbi:MAG TPA: hypothetical protein VGC91_09445 [Pyrinomonadaceae bacterium]|jgi:hypothetical protein
MTIKKLIAVGLMTLVLGAGAPVVLADGIQETPGVAGVQETPGKDGTQETPGVTGTQETPGSLILDMLVTLATTLVA